MRKNIHKIYIYISGKEPNCRKHKNSKSIKKKKRRSHSLKTGKGLSQSFCKRRYRLNWPIAHEKMICIINLQESTNENHRETSFYTQ
jgi:hypothetical protein